MANQATGEFLLDLIRRQDPGTFDASLSAGQEATEASDLVGALMDRIQGMSYESVEAEPVRPAQKILMGLASALSARGAARGGGRAVDYLGAEQDRRLRDAMIQNRQGRQAFQDERQMALLELQDLIGQRDKAQSRSERLYDTGQTVIREREREARADARADREMKFRTDLSEADRAHDKEMLRLRTQAEGDGPINNEAVGAGIGAANVLFRGSEQHGIPSMQETIAARMSDGESVQAIRSSMEQDFILDELDAMVLGERERAMVLVKFHERFQLALKAVLGDGGGPEKPERTSIMSPEPRENLSETVSRTSPSAFKGSETFLRKTGR